MQMYKKKCRTYNAAPPDGKNRSGTDGMSRMARKTGTRTQNRTGGYGGTGKLAYLCVSKSSRNIMDTIERIARRNRLRAGRGHPRLAARGDMAVGRRRGATGRIAAVGPADEAPRHRLPHLFVAAAPGRELRGNGAAGSRSGRGSHRVPQPARNRRGVRRNGTRRTAIATATSGSST